MGKRRYRSVVNKNTAQKFSSTSQKVIADNAVKVAMKHDKNKLPLSASPARQMHNIVKIMHAYAHRPKSKQVHRNTILKQVKKFYNLLQDHHQALLDEALYAENLTLFLQSLSIIVKSRKLRYSLNSDDLLVWLADTPYFADSASLSVLLKAMGELSFSYHLQGSLPSSLLEGMIQSLLQQSPTSKTLSDSLLGLRLLALRGNISGEISAALPIEIMKTLLSLTPKPVVITENLYNVALLMRSALCSTSADSAQMKALAKLALSSIELEYADQQQLAIACCYLDLKLPKVLLNKIRALSPAPQTIQQLLVERILLKFPNRRIEVCAEKLLGPFFVDVYIETNEGKGIVLEIDGPQHYRQPETLRQKDRLRDGYLRETWGVEVLRFMRVGMNDISLIENILASLDDDPLLTEASHTVLEKKVASPQQPSSTLATLTNPANVQGSFFYALEEGPTLAKTNHEKFKHLALQ